MPGRSSLIKKRAEESSEELDVQHLDEPLCMSLLGMYLYIALVTGPVGNLSSDFNTLVDFIARERAMQTIKLRGTNSVTSALKYAVRA